MQANPILPSISTVDLAVLSSSGSLGAGCSASARKKGRSADVCYTTHSRYISVFENRWSHTSGVSAARAVMSVRSALYCTCVHVHGGLQHSDVILSHLAVLCPYFTTHIVLLILCWGIHLNGNPWHNLILHFHCSFFQPHHFWLKSCQNLQIGFVVHQNFLH